MPHLVSPGYDFAVRVKQAKATTMTQAIAKLQGLGAMSEAEFRGAMESISRLESRPRNANLMQR